MKCIPREYFVFNVQKIRFGIKYYYKNISKCFSTSLLFLDFEKEKKIKKRFEHININWSLLGLLSKIQSFMYLNLT